MSGTCLISLSGWKTVQAYTALSVDSTGETYTPSGLYKNVFVRNVGSKNIWLGTGADPATSKGMLLLPMEWHYFANIEPGFTIPAICAAAETSTLAVVEG